MTNLLKSIRKRRTKITIFLFLVILTLIQLEFVDISKRKILIIFLIFYLLEFIDTIQTEATGEGLLEKIEEIHQNTKDTIRALKDKGTKRKREIKLLEEQIQWKEKYIKKTEATNQIINEIIEEGLITNDDLFNNMEDSIIYVLYCYATPYLPRGYGLPLELRRDRKYPEFLKEMGFIRLRRQEVFLTTKDRIKPRFREISRFKKYLLKEFKPLLKEEWETLLNDLSSKKEHAQVYKELSKRKYDDEYKINFIIIRDRINKDNLGLLHGEIFNENIRELFRRDITKNRLRLPEEKKSRIKKHILAISIEHIFIKKPMKDLKIIKTLESRLKRKLKIEKITDYSRKSEEDITDIFSKKFPDEKASEYAIFLKDRATEYRKALKNLGISDR